MNEEKETDNISSVSNTRSYEEMADFWDTHSLADYEEQTHEAEVIFEPEAQYTYVSIERELMNHLRQIARQQQVSPQTLIDLWLRNQMSLHSQTTV